MCGGGLQRYETEEDLMSVVEPESSENLGAGMAQFRHRGMKLAD